MAVFRQSSQAHGAGLSPYARNTIQEAIRHAEQPAAVTASAVGGSATRSVVAESLDDERFLHAARSRVLLDEPGTSLRACFGERVREET